jgi:hypothetical protein
LAGRYSLNQIGDPDNKLILQKQKQNKLEGMTAKYLE